MKGVGCRVQGVRCDRLRAPPPPRGCVDPSFRALSGRLEFTVRRHTFNKDSLSRPRKTGLVVGLSALNSRALQGCHAHKKLPTPLRLLTPLTRVPTPLRLKALGIVSLQGPRRPPYLMSAVPLYLWTSLKHM